MRTVVHTTSTSYVVARRQGGGIPFADALGRWVESAHYAFPHKDLDEARKFAERRGAFVCERHTDTHITHTVILPDDAENTP